MDRGSCIRVDDLAVLDASLPHVKNNQSVFVIGGRFETEADFNAAVAQGATVQRIEGRNRLLVPGFVNSHTHSPLNILKGTGDALSHPAFMWQNQADTAGRSPEEIEISALLGCVEHLLCGTTSIVDHFPEQGFGPGDVDAVVRAYQTAGIRALVALRLFDEPYTDIQPPAGTAGLQSTLNPLNPAPLRESLAVLEQSIERHHRPFDSLISIAPGPSNPMRCSDALLRSVSDIAEHYDSAIHIHLLETSVQAEIAQQRYGTTMVKHLNRLGLLGPRLSCAHTIWIDEDDIDLMAQRGAIVVHNPESNCKLGAGIAPISRMLDAGVTVALGTDGASTNDNLDLHETMRFAAMLQRPLEKDRKRWPSVRHVLDMATIAGGMVMRVPGLGLIQPGAPADFVLHDLREAAWVPLNDPFNQLVFSATGSSVRSVVVAGRLLVSDRKILSFDAEAVLHEARGLVAKLRERNAGMYTLASMLAEQI